MIDRAEVRRIAALAHLSVAPEEEERLAKELSGILAYVERLQELDTEGVPPAAAADNPGALRDDAVLPCLTPEQALENAPAVVLTAFSVPRIIE
jgi:aspartyl-tRNA(Asn)/glutamyl-tRNA(Gln) amidotransferase subunit C